MSKGKHLHNTSLTEHSAHTDIITFNRRSSIRIPAFLGDADLYISGADNPNPDYEFFDLKSSTCGVDVVDITELKRPIYIG